MTDLAALEARLQLLEDTMAVTQAVASYGPLVDAGDSGPVAELWAEDGSYDVPGWMMSSRADVAAMVESDAHQGLISRGALHFLGPARVKVEGDLAVAVCPSILVVHHEGRFVTHRAGYHHLRLRRTPSGWEVTTRVTRATDGGAEARGLADADSFEV